MKSSNPIFIIYSRKDTIDYYKKKEYNFMKKLTAIQEKAMVFMKAQIDEARKQNIDLKKTKKIDLQHAQEILNAQNGIVFSPGGDCTIRTLRALEKMGLIEILCDNSGIGTGFGAFPSVVRVLNY